MYFKKQCDGISRCGCMQAGQGHVVSRANLGTVADDNGNGNVSPGLRAPGDVSRRKFVIYVEKEYVLQKKISKSIEKSRRKT